MINRCILLLATLVGQVSALGGIAGANSADALANLWLISDPILGAANKSFEFKYGNISSVHDVPAGAVKATWYDSGCKEGGAPFYLQYAAGQHNTTYSATLFNVTSLDRDPDDPPTVVLDFDTVPKEVAKVGMPLYYTGDNENVMMYCVRFGLEAGGIEINFLETLVNISISLSGDFLTDTLTVKPKDKTNTTSEINYQVDAQLCGPQGPFNQGDVISVCVHPDLESLADGIIMDFVSAFAWTRGDIGLTQIAIKEGFNNQAADALTFVDITQRASENGGNGFPYPHIRVSSVLYATYYQNEGSVQASGSATMKFPERRRRLGADEAPVSAERRRLEDEGIPPSPFDISAGVRKGTDGPVTLQTAAGPSQSYAFGATIVGLVSAVLLA